MDTNSIITIASVAATGFGGFWSGRRMTVATAVDVVDLLQAQVGILTTKNDEKDVKISVLEGKVDALEALVTQRAEVDAVHREVVGMRGVVDRIAEKVEA